MRAREVEEGFIFILDKGDLSAAEVVSYLDARRVDYTVVERSDEALILSSSKLRPQAAASDLGGTFKIGVVKCSHPLRRSVDLQGLLRTLDGHTFYEGLADKAPWAVSVYGGAQQERSLLLARLEEYFSSRLRREGVKKAKCLSPTRIYEKDVRAEVLAEDVARRRVVKEGFEVLAAFVDGTLYIGSTLAVIDHEGFRRRDLQRPFQKSAITIPPRLARIMLNLAGVSKGMVVLDPFCGLGTILMEALLLGADVLGVDLDGRRVREAVANLRWLSSKERIKASPFEGRIIQGDARRLNILIKRESVDAVVTEPILLPPLRVKPSPLEARRLLSASERIYAEALVGMRDVLKRNGRVVFTTPVVETRGGGMVSFSLSQAIRRAGLASAEIRSLSLKPPFSVGEGEEIVHRDVHVLVKR